MTSLSVIWAVGRGLLASGHGRAIAWRSERVGAAAAFVLVVRIFYFVILLPMEQRQQGSVFLAALRWAIGS
jgi:hypothetical protein